MTILSAQSTNMAILQKIILLKTIRTSRGVSLSPGMLNTYKSHKMQSKAKKHYYHRIIVGF
jgi:hypothetical protein